MDPHSRFSQFNSRQTKAGPIQASRSMEQSLKTTNPLETYKKRSAAQRSRSSSSVSVLATRPIVSNSRIKQDEQYRKDMYLAFINNALQQKSKGISDAFDELVDQFNSKQLTSDTQTSPAQLRLWLIALSHVISRLERTHAPLIESIVSMPWTIMDSAFVKSYTSFLGMLVSAKPEYLTMILGKVASGLTYQSGLQALNAGIPESSSRPLTRRVVYDRMHSLLQHLLSLVPTLPSTLQPLLVRNFPHKRQNQASQVTYIRNLLRITEYCPELSDRIFATIIDRAIQIDVEIQVELEELEEHVGDDAAEIFDLDPFDTVVGQEGESDSEDESDDEGGGGFSDISSEAEEVDEVEDTPPQEPTNLQHVQDMVNKLDAILKNIFDHFTSSRQASHEPIPQTLSSSSLLSPLDSPSLASSGIQIPLPSEEETKVLRRTQFYTLLSIFDRTILRTFKSRYTQFLVFWFSSLDPEFSDLFQGMLVSKALLEEDQPAVTRSAAASYIASFVSRAQFVGRDSTRQAVACMCNFLKNRLDLLDTVAQSGAQTPSMAQHTVFYAVTQAVFLIFCFRWRDLQHEPEDVDELAEADVPASKWMPELNILKRVVQSELNPLKVCASNVVMQFARVAHATDFLYCYSIIEANRRVDFAPKAAQNGAKPSLSRSNSSFVNLSVSRQTLHSELNTFFPFDPYRLPRSSSYIDGVYREWSSVAIDEEDEDSDDDSDDHEDNVEEGNDEASDAGHDPENPPSVVGAIPVMGARAKSSDSITDGLGVSFVGMSISPARPSLSLSVTIPMSVS
ncbi:RNA polymerase I-specific transcription initiation factor RRN3 [Trametopsis cervina]|nr:RNA polymerase I-specific transcription initiation factor RRN3 [Trametopsis cervina]